MPPTVLGEEILVHLYVNGVSDLPANIADNINRSRSGISQKLPELEEQGFVKPKGRGVWRLTGEGASYAASITSDYNLAVDGDGFFDGE